MARLGVAGQGKAGQGDGPIMEIKPQTTKDIIDTIEKSILDGIPLIIKYDEQVRVVSIITWKNSETISFLQHLPQYGFRSMKLKKITFAIVGSNQIYSEPWEFELNK